MMRTTPERPVARRAPIARVHTRAQLWLTWLAVAALPLLSHSRVSAQTEADDSTRAAARRLGAQGIEAYQANDFATAADKLDRALKLYTTTTLGLWSARAHLQLGQLVEAAERYREALRANIVGDAEAQQRAQQEARTELERLLPRIPTLTITLENARPDAVVVTLDEASVPSALIGEARPTNPGRHSVVAEHNGERQTLQVLLLEGEQKQAKLAFRGSSASVVANTQDLRGPSEAGGEPIALTPRATEMPLRAAEPAREPEATMSPLKPIGVVSMAFGGAGLATAGITALIANGKRGQCPDNVCPPDVKQTYDGLRSVSTIAFYAGAGLAVGGLVMWLVAPNAETASQTVSLRLGPGSLDLHGRF